MPQAEKKASISTNYISSTALRMSLNAMEMASSSTNYISSTALRMSLNEMGKLRSRTRQHPSSHMCENSKSDRLEIHENCHGCKLNTTVHGDMKFLLSGSSS